MERETLVAEIEKQAEGEIRQQLHTIPRTGWVRRGVTNPETVLEHTDALVELHAALQDKILDVDHARIRRMLEIHDWAESIVGDIVTATVEEAQRGAVELDKQQKEEIAMREICARFPKQGNEIFTLWEEYEKRETVESQITYQLDKLQAIIKASEYMMDGETVDYREFIQLSADKIHHPVLKEILHTIQTAVPR